MLLRNARIGDDEPVDVVLNNAVGGITGIGDAVEHPNDDTVEIDLDGRWLNPGLWDNHVHFSQWALARQRLDLSRASSAKEAAALVGAAIRSDSPTPFVGAGFSDAMWSDAPNLADLDDAAGRHPVVLISHDLHSVWLNSAAIEQHGHAGHPTGLLREDDAFAVTTRVAQVADEDLDRYALEAAQAAAARGVVGFVDYEMSWNYGTWLRRQHNGNVFQRVEFGVYPQHLDRAVDVGLHTGQAIGPLLEVGRLKVITDGSLNTRTAYCYDPYPGTDSRGLLTVPPSELQSLMQLAVGFGFELAVHAIGDEANSLALDAFFATGATGSIEHAQLLASADLERFEQLGIVASVQPEHAMDDRDVAEHYWAGRTDRAFVLRSLLDAKAQLAMGSDAPVAPLDPWITMAAAVGRSRDGREPWHPEQAITVREAYDASRRFDEGFENWIEFDECDFVVTDIDPLAATPEQLRTMPVAATILDGEFTFNAL